MKYISPLISDGRGKLGGTVYARNRAGVYVRNKTIPAQPRTASQVSNRASFAANSTAWASLTQTQRNGWNTLALQAILQDSLGHTYNPSGLQLYVSCARNLTAIGVTPISNAPKFYRLPALQTAVSVTFPLLAGNPHSVILVTALSTPALTTNLKIQATPGLRPGITFVGRAIYRKLPHTWAVDQTSINLDTQYPAVFPAPHTGQSVFFRVSYVEPTTGFASPWKVVVAIVTGS